MGSRAYDLVGELRIFLFRRFHLEWQIKKLEAGEGKSIVHTHPRV